MNDDVKIDVENDQREQEQRDEQVSEAPRASEPTLVTKQSKVPNT